MILVGGSNVSPAEIEGALEEHPALRCAAVIGLPDDDLGSVPHTIVQADGDVDEAALLAHLRDRLASYKVPRTSSSSPSRCATPPARSAGPPPRRPPPRPSLRRGRKHSMIARCRPRARWARSVRLSSDPL
jgi:hypothetical protein